MGSAASTAVASPIVVGDLQFEDLAKLAENAGQPDVAEVVRVNQIDGARAAAIDDQDLEAYSQGQELQRVNLQEARRNLLDSAVIKPASGRAGWHDAANGTTKVASQLVASPHPEAAGEDPDYSDKNYLLELLREGHVTLAKPSLFIEYYKLGKPLPKQQDIPEQYILKAADLTEDLEIISISYCWITPDHPDPEGYYLQVVSKLLEKFLVGKYEEAKREKRYTMSIPQPADKDSSAWWGAAWWLKNNGFSFGAGDGRPVGVFFDWTSLPQDKPKGSRSFEETARFKAALKNINIWYAHADTITWLLTSLPDGVMRRGHDDSGWTTFERLVGGIISTQSKLLRIGAGARGMLLRGEWDEDHDCHPGDYVQLSMDIMDTERGPPVTPDAFEVAIDSKYFTNGADKGAIVIPKYEETFNEVIVDAKELNYTGIGFDDEEARELLNVIRTKCTKGILKRLNLNMNNDISVPFEEWASLAGEFELEELQLGFCYGIGGGIACVSGLVHLKNLTIGFTNIAGDIAACAGFVHLTCLQLCSTRVSGNIGSISESMKLTSLDLGHSAVSGDIGNCITGMAHLQKLLFYRTGVTGNISCVSGLVNLMHLKLYETSVCGDIKALAGLVLLTKLVLHQTRVAGDLASICGLMQLQILTLSDTDVTGDISSSITCFQHLTELDLRRTSVLVPDGCPRDGDGNIWYPDAKSCKALLQWVSSEGLLG